MIRTIIVVAVVFAFTATLRAIPAHAAARDRDFVASYGSDSNPCTFGSPCKTFQQAINVVAAGGEVTAIDSAGFGPINITKSVTITSPAGVEAGIVPDAGGDAIDINAGVNDVIILRGLTLNGSGSGHNGVVFNSGASLIISDCVVENFVQNDVFSETTGNGILIQPTSNATDFTITDTIASNNEWSGIHYTPQAATNTTGAVDHVVANNNQEGIEIDASNGGGPSSVAISNSVVSNNSYVGIIVTNFEALTVSIDNARVSGNGIGIQASNSSNLILSRSTITGNLGNGVVNDTNSNTIYSYQDNRINGNATGGTGMDVIGGLNTHAFK